MKWQGKYSQNFKQLKNYESRKQRRGFLNRYNFTYVDRDTTKAAVTQLNRIALNLAKKKFKRNCSDCSEKDTTNY